MAPLEGRVCLVTGAGRGIGAATVAALVSAGASVVATDLDATAVEAAARAIDASLSRVHPLGHDVTDEDDWTRAVASAVERFGGLDVLVNNAGLFMSRPIEHTTTAELRRVLAVNLEGVFLGARHAIGALRDPARRARCTGSIVNLSSVAGLVGSAGAAAYCMSKGGVRLFTKAAALEFAPDRVRVNSIHPGIVDTDMGRAAMAHRATSATAARPPPCRPPRLTACRSS